AEYVEVWRDDTVTVLENQNVLPHAWIVHEAVELDPTTALAQINSGAIDLKTTATVEQSPPSMSIPADASTDSVSVTHYSPDRVTIQATAASDGLLVLSDVYDPDWSVTVDGKHAELYVVNGVLRGVALPAGTHTVSFNYESDQLRYGLIISMVTIVGLIAFLAYVFRGSRRS
ncbi:MAG: YfhO family protein, partial [Thermomicrobiales bacterium]